MKWWIFYNFSWLILKWDSLRMSIMYQVNCYHYFLNTAKIWPQNEKAVKLQICEIIYERNFENNFIVFLEYINIYFKDSIENSWLYVLYIL